MHELEVTVHELEVTVTFENVIKGNYSIEYPGPFLNNNQFLIRNQSHDVGNFITLLTRLYTVSSYWITISLFGMKIKLFFCHEHAPNLYIFIYCRRI